MTKGSSAGMSRTADDWKNWRRRLKALAPFVRRREHERLQRRHQEVMDALHGRVPHACEAAALVRKDLPAGLAGEVCIFLAFAPGPHLEVHALHHVRHLLQSGIAVLLVVNAAVPLDQVELPSDVLAGCAGVVVRANEGLDFAAWAHVFVLSDRTSWERLYLVNDSIAGPLSPGALRATLERVRASDADHLGLTWSAQPIPHLQSYFLVFNRRLLASRQLQKFMAGVYSFPDKATVVDSYEVRLTQQLLAGGYTCASVFPEYTGGLGDAATQLDDLAALERMGFPYVKMSLLRRFPDDPRTARARQQGGVDGNR